MIHITFKCSKNHLIGFDIKGHADFAEAGEDILCAAVSIYSINTINSIEELIGIKYPIHYAMKDGDLSLDILWNQLNEKEKEQCELLMRSMELAFKSLECDYDKYLKIYYKEVEKC